MLNIGDAAPDMEVETHPDGLRPLSSYWQEKPLVLYFYPKDETKVCTKQACSMQSFPNLDQNANCLGVSTDSIHSHEKFAEKHNLKFPLVADRKGSLAKAYKAHRPIINICKRITYVIDTQGIVRGAAHAELRVDIHEDMIRQTLAQLRE